MKGIVKVRAESTMRSAPFRRFNKNHFFLVSKSFGTKKSFENSFDVRVTACARSMFLAVIGIQLCSVKYHRARLSALRQVLSCSHAMLRRVGKYRIYQKIRHPAFSCGRSNSIASCTFICVRSNPFVFARNATPFCWVLGSSVKRQKSSEEWRVFRSQKRAKRARKLEAHKTF